MVSTLAPTASSLRVENESREWSAMMMDLYSSAQELAQQKRLELRHVEGVTRAVAIGANYKRAFLGIFADASVRAAHQLGTDGNDVHEIAEAGHFFGERPGHLELDERAVRVEEQL